MRFVPRCRRPRSGVRHVPCGFGAERHKTIIGDNDENTYEIASSFHLGDAIANLDGLQ
jgi:hypothetical protein